VNNLGFNVYRDTGGKLVPVNQQLIAGSALQVGAEIELRSGHTYQWWDSQPADKSTAYWIEDRDLKGESRWHGPFYIQSQAGERKSADLKIQQAKTLAALAVTDTPSVDVETRATLPALTNATSPIQAVIAVQPPGNAVKLAIQQEGFYRLTQADLLAA